MWYVYILNSLDHDWTYVGDTSNLEKRFSSHNKGLNKATIPYAPFKLSAYVAVESRDKTRNLEAYFKTGSGRAWFNKRLITNN